MNVDRSREALKHARRLIEVAQQRIERSRSLIHEQRQRDSRTDSDTLIPAAYEGNRSGQT